MSLDWPALCMHRWQRSPRRAMQRLKCLSCFPVRDPRSALDLLPHLCSASKLISKLKNLGKYLFLGSGSHNQPHLMICNRKKNKDPIIFYQSFLEEKVIKNQSLIRRSLKFKTTLRVCAYQITFPNWNVFSLTLIPLRVITQLSRPNS